MKNMVEHGVVNLKQPLSRGCKISLTYLDEGTRRKRPRKWLIFQPNLFLVEVWGSRNN